MPVRAGRRSCPAPGLLPATIQRVEAGRQAVNADLAALIPPAVICVAVLVAVGAFLRHEMSSRRGGDEGGAAGIGDTGNGGTVTGSAGETPKEGQAETTERGSAPRQ